MGADFLQRKQFLRGDRLDDGALAHPVAAADFRLVGHGQHIVTAVAGVAQVRLTEQEQIEAALNAEGAKEGKTFWIHTKDPDVQAAADLLNRAIGKPVEEIQMEVTTNEPLAARMKQARDRVAKLKG